MTSCFSCLTDDYIAIGADCEHIAAQIEEYILTVRGFLNGLHVSRPLNACALRKKWDCLSLHKCSAATLLVRVLGLVPALLG